MGADLAPIDAGIRVVEGGSGRSAIAPAMLFARWRYATIEGEGRARAIARLTQSHAAYRWICGGYRSTLTPGPSSGSTLATRAMRY
jgi:transposase